jgi:hypothetical protein
MLLGQNAAKKHTKERTSENAREYDQTDYDEIHDQHSLRRQAVLKNSVSPSRTRHGAFGKTLKIPLGENCPQSGSRDLRWTRLSCYIRPGGRKTSTNAVVILRASDLPRRPLTGELLHHPRNVSWQIAEAIKVRGFYQIALNRASTA